MRKLTKVSVVGLAIAFLVAYLYGVWIVCVDDVRLENELERRVRMLETPCGRTVEEVLFERYGQENIMWERGWTYGFNVYFVIMLPHDPKETGCSSEVLRWYRYRWNVSDERIVANSQAALELTPGLAPPVWNALIADGCIPAPFTESDIDQWDRFMQEQSRRFGDPCSQTQCDVRRMDESRLPLHLRRD